MEILSNKSFNCEKPHFPAWLCSDCALRFTEKHETINDTTSCSKVRVSMEYNFCLKLNIKQKNFF